MGFVLDIDDPKLSTEDIRLAIESVVSGDFPILVLRQYKGSPQLLIDIAKEFLGLGDGYQFNFSKFTTETKINSRAPHLDFLGVDSSSPAVIITDIQCKQTWKFWKTPGNIADYSHLPMQALVSFIVGSSVQTQELKLNPGDVLVHLSRGPNAPVHAVLTKNRPIANKICIVFDYYKKAITRD